MANIVLSIVLFALACFLLLGSYLMLTRGIELIKNDGYYYEQDISHKSGHQIHTFVWKDGEIIESWIDPITDDSSATLAGDRAKEFIELMKAQ